MAVSANDKIVRGADLATVGSQVKAKLAEKVSSENIDNMFYLTSAEYEALATKDPNTIYVVTDGGAELYPQDGKSAYQIWLDNGNVGSEADFLASLQGNSGYSGAAGELEVVNNLNDGGATAALSAEMGKTLNSEVTQLGQKITGSKKNYIAGKKYANNGLLVDDADYTAITELIPVAGGSNVTFSLGTSLLLFKANKAYDDYFSQTTDPRTVTLKSTSVFIGVSFPTSRQGNVSLAINGVNYPIVLTEDVVGAAEAIGTSFDNENTFLSAGNVQNAITELDNQRGKILYERTKNDYTPLGDYFLRSTGVLGSSNNYEQYCIRAEGVASIKATLYDTDNVQYAVALIDESGNISSDSVRSFGGVQNIYIKELSDDIKYILICNRKASGEGQFTIKYKAINQIEGNAIYLGDLVNSDTSSGELASSGSDNLRVTSHSICAFPEQGIKVTAHLPWKVQAYFWYTPPSASSAINVYTPYLNDGDVFSFPKTATHFRIVFRLAENQLLAKDDVIRLIESGDIYFSYDFADENMVIRNLDKSARVGAAKRNLTGLLDGMDSMFVFGHISDLHGDSVRLANCAEYCNHIGVDALLNSGDSVMYKAKDYNSFAKDIMSKYPNIPYFFCVGNHESLPSGQMTLFADNIEPLVDTYGYLKSLNTPADNCYYYKDFSEKKIRLVVLNYYNNGIYTGSLGQSQIDWFITTLSSTPAGYGVLVMLHSPEDKVVAESPYNVFYQKVRVVEYQENGFYVGNRPIMHIIDAFISKATYNGTYTDNGESVTISADFSSIDATTEFIAYVVGHRHEDWIGYYNNATNKQLSLGVTAGIGLYGHGSNAAFANQEDLPRGGVGVCQDAFNIYAIDRVHKLVKVVRIGADLTFNFERREYMEIPYMD